MQTIKCSRHKNGEVGTRRAAIERGLILFTLKTHAYGRVVHLLVFVLASNLNILTTGTQDLNWVKQFFHSLKPS